MNVIMCICECCECSISLIICFFATVITVIICCYRYKVNKADHLHEIKKMEKQHDLKQKITNSINK